MDVYSIVNKPIQELIDLPDLEAAESLSARMDAFDWADQVHELSYAERGIIAREFQNRQLWKLVINPRTGDPYISFNAWAAKSGRATTFESKRDIEELPEIPDEELKSIPKQNLKTLRQLSSQVRTEPKVIQAAQKLTPEDFLAHLEANHKNQHIESRVPMRFSPVRSQADRIEQALKLAQLHGARTKEEGLELICQIAIQQWEDEELIREAIA